jgi:hypothetical protein
LASLCLLLWAEMSFPRLSVKRDLNNPLFALVQHSIAASSGTIQLLFVFFLA